MFETGHLITIAIVVSGYVVTSLLAWGGLRSDVHSMREKQKTLVDHSDLKAAVAEMKSELYKALGERRDSATHDRRKG